MSYYDDLPIGVRRDFGSYTFEKDDVIEFAKKFDPQRFHLSEEGAAETHFGRLCASGWHTASIWMKLNTLRWQKEIDAYVAAGHQRPVLGPSPGFEDLKWLKPVFVGDTISFFGTFTGKRALKSKPGWAMLNAQNEGINQHGDLVFSFTGHVMIAVE